MPYSTAGKNLMLDALRGTNPTVAIAYASLHTASPGDDGSNEVTGGIPGLRTEGDHDRCRVRRRGGRVDPAGLRRPGINDRHPRGFLVRGLRWDVPRVRGRDRRDLCLAGDVYAHERDA